MLNVIGVNMPPVSMGVIAMPESEDAKQFSAERKHLYISGPMTGLPEYNYPAFNAAARACSLQATSSATLLKEACQPTPRGSSTCAKTFA